MNDLRIRIAPFLAAVLAAGSTAPALAARVSAPNTALARGALVRQVAGRTPVLGRQTALAAKRPLVRGARSASMRVSAKANKWQLEATLPGAVVHDISFPSKSVGYAAAELGQVWKTTDGGKTWSKIVNLGFPYYFFGITALNKNDVVVSGFNDSNFQGLIRWSHDGGATWTNDIVLTTTGWSYRVRFADKKHGLVVDGLNISGPNAAHYTTDGGAAATDWTADVPDPNGGWFGNQFSLLSNLHARMSGITYCSSTNGGAAWSCGPSVDNVFDGPTFFNDDTYGWVGGGEISPQVEGWVHRTTDGGTTWSGRTLDDPFPIREIRFLSPNVGWAAGGNIYSNIGGIYFSADGGQTWALDVDTNGHEMDACDSVAMSKGYRVWCAGYDSSFNGAVYTLRYKGSV